MTAAPGLAVLDALAPASADDLAPAGRPAPATLAPADDLAPSGRPVPHP